MVLFTKQEQRVCVCVCVCVETNLESLVNAEFCDINTIDPDHLVACVCIQAQYRELVNRVRHLGPPCSNMSLCSCYSSQAQLFRPVTQYSSLQFHFLHPHLTPGHQDEPALRYFTCGYMYSCIAVIRRSCSRVYVMRWSYPLGEFERRFSGLK